MMRKEQSESVAFSFSPSELEVQLATFGERGITEFTLQDESVLSHKGKLLKFLGAFREKCPGVFLTLPVDASVLDLDVCRLCSELFCSIEIALEGTEKNGAYLLDKKFFSRRAETLNTLGLVFGFDMTFAAKAGDSVRLFRDRLDFALSLCPNHIDFPQLASVFKAAAAEAKPTRTFSTQDIEMVSAVAFACETFYSCGRAVAWFLPALRTLKVSASKLLQDFGEWQRVNSCGINSCWNPAEASHAEIEKMQLAFLAFKFEEKGALPAFAALSDIVRLNGALSRAAGEGEETVLSLSYSPDDLLSGESQNLASFAENVTMEKCTVRVFLAADGPDYRIES